MRLKPEQYFYLNNGRVLRNLSDLKKQLVGIDENTFRHHVNENKNDFYNWIKGTLKKGELAEKIKKDRDKGDMIKHLKEPIRKTARRKKIEKKISKRKQRKRRIRKKPIKKRIEAKKPITKTRSAALKDEGEENQLKLILDYIRENKGDFIVGIAVGILIALILTLAVYVK